MSKKILLWIFVTAMVGLGVSGVMGFFIPGGGGGLPPIPPPPIRLPESIQNQRMNFDTDAQFEQWWGRLDESTLEGLNLPPYEDTTPVLLKTFPRENILSIVARATESARAAGASEEQIEEITKAIVDAAYEGGEEAAAEAAAEAAEVIAGEPAAQPESPPPPIVARKDYAQYAEFSKFFNSLPHWAGYGGLTKILNIPERNLKDYRRAIEEFFDNFILGGVDYYTSLLCQNNIRNMPDSFASTEFDGISTPTIFVNGERANVSDPLANGNETYIYKFSYYMNFVEEYPGQVTAGETFNIYLIGDKGEVPFFVDENTGAEAKLSMKRDEPFSDIHVMQSGNYYSKICLRMSTEFDFVRKYARALARRGDKSEICNTIVDAGSQPPTLYGVTPSGAAGGPTAAPVVNPNIYR